MFQQFQQQCHVCDGKGKVIEHVCPSCTGKKVRRGNENYSIHIEKGMKDDHKIVSERVINLYLFIQTKLLFISQILDGEADEYPDTTPGNMIFIVKTMPHPVFERRGNNLYTKQHITLIEALGGFEKTMSHLDNSTIVLKREGVTQYGYVQTLEGLGMPFEENHSKYGDLFVEYKVIFPTEVDSETLECNVYSCIRNYFSQNPLTCNIFLLRFEEGH